MKILIVLALIALAGSLIALNAANDGSEIAREVLRYLGPLAILLGIGVFVRRVVTHLWARDHKNIQE